MPGDHEHMGAHSVQGRTLLSLLPTVARGLGGLTEEQAIFDAVAALLCGSDDLVLVLRVAEDGTRMRIAAASIGTNVARALEVFIGGPLEQQRKSLRSLPTFSSVIEGDAARVVPVSELCREAFEDEVAGKVAGLLGGGSAMGVLSPLHAPTATGDHEAVGVLCVVSPTPDHTHVAATSALAEIINASLSLSAVLRNLRVARSTLSADHAAQHYLGAAMRSAGLGAPSAPRSLIPSRPTVTLHPPPSPRDSWVPQETEDEPLPSRTKVLLVEDEQRVRKSTVALLAGLGYSVVGVASGEHAIATYTRAKDRREPFSVVLLDQTLSGRIGGVETLRLIRSVDPDVRAILLSGQPNNRGREQVDRFGFQQCLEKPVTVDALSSAIEQVLATSP